MTMSDQHDDFGPVEYPELAVIEGGRAKKARRKSEKVMPTTDRAIFDCDGMPNFAMADKAIPKLASRNDVFQRWTTLVDCVRLGEDVVDRDGWRIPQGTPQVRLIPRAQLKGKLEREICFVCTRKDKTFECGPPAQVVADIETRGQWQLIRALESVVEWPLLRPNGTVFVGPGYDNERVRSRSVTPTSMCRRNQRGKTPGMPSKGFSISWSTSRLPMMRAAAPG
jgi:hypothetical protein